LVSKAARCSAQTSAQTRVYDIFKKKWLEVSLEALEKHFAADDEITPEVLHRRGIIKKAKHDIVVLGNGEVSKSLKVSAHRFTKALVRKSKRPAALSP